MLRILLLMAKDLDQQGDMDVFVIEEVMEIVKGTFQPEFLNRLDEILVFNRLSRRDMKTIVDIQLSNLTERLDRQDVMLEIDDAAKVWLANEGYNPVYGARPLRRIIQKRVENILALNLLAGKISSGNTVNISVSNNCLTFNGEIEEVI